MNAWKQGDLPESELLYAQAELHNMNQRGSEAYDAEDIASKYRLLQPGEYVLDLQDMANRSTTGRIVEAPQNFTLYPGRLGATWELSVTTGRRSVDIRMDTDTLHLSRAIGHEAVAAVVSETYLSWHDRSLSNIDELKNLHSKISGLHELGMPAVETTLLDDAIAEWEKHHSSSSGRSEEEPLDETADVKSLWRRIFGKISSPGY